MKKIFLFLLSIVSLTTFGQVYNPSKHTVTNKGLGVAQAAPTDARSKFYDEDNFVYRAYVDTAEVKSYLSLPKYRDGQFDIIVNTGGTLLNGVITGGTNEVWYFKNGTDDDDLVLKSADVSALVPKSTLININGTEQDLSANRSWTIPTFTDPTTTNGDLIIRSGGVLTRLGIGTANQSLVVSGGGIPAWTSTQRWSGDFTTIATSATNATLTDNTPMYTYTGTGGNTFTLPTTVDGSFFIKNSGSGSLTIQRGGSATIYTTSSVTSFTLEAGQAVFLTGYATTSTWQSLFATAPAVDTSSLSERIDERPILITLADLRLQTSPPANAVYYVYDGKNYGFFKYDASDASSADDTATIIVAGSARFKRQFDNVIFPEWWLAAGDNSTDDGPAFNRMYRWMERTANRSWIVGHRSREYRISTTINLPKTLTSAGEFRTFMIDGNGATYTTTSAINVIERTPASQTEAGNSMIGAYKLIIDGLKIEGNSTTGQVGLNLSALYTPTIQNCYFYALDTGVVAKFWLNPIIKGNHFGSNKSVAFKGASGSGYWTSATTSNSAFNAAHIESNRVYNANGAFAAFQLLATDGVVMDGNISEGFNPRYDIYSDYQSASVVNGNTFSNTWFESNGGTYATNTCFYLNAKGSVLINTLQNDYADTLIKFAASMPESRIIAKNWTFFNSGVTTLFDGNGVLNSSVTMEVSEMPVSLIESFFTASKWSSSTVGVVMGATGYVTSGGRFGLRSTGTPMAIDAGTSTINTYSGEFNVWNNAAGLRVYNSTSDATNYNRTELYTTSGTSILNAGKGGTGVASSWQIQLNGTSKLSIDANNVIIANGILPGTDNTYDIGRTSGPFRHRTGYFATSVGIGITVTPLAGLHINKTTEQIRSGYDASNYMSVTTASAGSTTFDLTGTSPVFQFNKRLTAFGTTEQFRNAYDASNYMSVTTGSTGSTTFDLTGTTPNFTFSDDIAASTNITLADYTTTTPSAPSDGGKIFSRQRAGVNTLSVLGERGKAWEYQRSIYSGKVGFLQARGGDATIDGLGLRQVASGSATAVTPSFSGSLFASMVRVGFSSTTVAGTISGIRNNVQYWSIGDATGKGGFFLVLRGGMASFVSDGRGVFGFRSSTAALTNVDPSSLTNILAFGYDAADTDWYFMHNDGSGTATRVALGTAGQFPCKTTATDWYEFRIYVPSQGTTVYYSIERLNTGDFVEGSVTTDLPAATTGLSYLINHTNNASASAAQFDLGSLYIESEN